MNSLPELQEKRRIAYQELLEVTKMYREAKINFEALELKYTEAQGIYNNLEYRCAELDGRLVHIDEKKTTKSSREKRIQDEESTKEFMKTLDKDELDKLLIDLGVIQHEIIEVEEETLSINEEAIND